MLLKSIFEEASKKIFT